MTPISETDTRNEWLGPLFYSASVSFCAGLLSFLILLVVALRTADGEQAMWYGVTWVFMLPWILMAGFLGRISFRWYRQQLTWIRTTAVFLATVVLAMIVGVALGYGFVRVIA